jgi:hypothetical protein
MSASHLIAYLLLGVQYMSLTPLAHAYRNPERFGAGVIDGGGGERYFTGSRAEGYTCQVCHTVGEPVPVSVSLPESGYIPGQVYRLTVDWPDDLDSVALNLEITDELGRALGDMVAPDPAQLGGSDLCLGARTPTSGVTIVATTDGRRVATVAECGQHQASIDWRAPATAIGGWLTGSVLVSNRDEKIDGDHVTNFGRVLHAVSAPQPRRADFAGGCDAIPRRPSVPATSVAIVVTVWVLCARQHKRKRKSIESTGVEG